MLPAAGFCETFTTVVAPMEGECWWGGVLNDGMMQPYRDCDEIDLAAVSHGGATAPLFVSSRGRYVWSDRPFRYSWKNGVLTIVSDFGKVEPVQAGNTLRDAYLAACSRHFPFDGSLPAKEMFSKPQFNNWIESSIFGINQENAEKYIEDLSASGFPCGVLMIDGGWMRQHGTLRFNEDIFPDARALFAKIHSCGWKGLLWMAYFISGDNRQEYLDYRLKSPRKEALMLESREYPGEECIVNWWAGKSVTLDLTNPRAFEVFENRLEEFASEYGIDGFKFDGGDAEYFRGKGKFHEEWMRGCDFAAAYNRLGLRFPLHEFRAGFKTGGMPLIQRLQDVDHSWEGLRSVILDIQAAGLLGYPYTFGDMIGGGLSRAYFPGRSFSHKLMIRSCQAQALMPMMQFSVAPWRVLTEEECAICRRFAQLHVEFSEYIWGLVRNAAQTGEPIVRAMEYEFPGQGFAAGLTQYMLGSRYLVAPVVSEDDSVVVKLPEGRWKDDLGKRYKGPAVLELENVPIDRLPYFERY